VGRGPGGVDRGVRRRSRRRFDGGRHRVEDRNPKWLRNRLHRRPCRPRRLPPTTGRRRQLCRHHHPPSLHHRQPSGPANYDCRPADDAAAATTLPPPTTTAPPPTTTVPPADDDRPSTHHYAASPYDHDTSTDNRADPHQPRFHLRRLRRRLRLPPPPTTTTPPPTTTLPPPPTTTAWDLPGCRGTSACEPPPGYATLGRLRRGERSGLLRRGARPGGVHRVGRSSSWLSKAGLP
jgi:hypothetical protein